MRVRVASGVAFFIVREARSSSFVVVQVACGCGVEDGVGRGAVRDASSCGSKGVIARNDRGTKRDYATGTSAEKAQRGGGRTPPTVANLGGPGFTERDKACGGDGHAMGACVGRTVGTGVRVDAHAAQPSRAASVRDARRET